MIPFPAPGFEDIKQAHDRIRHLIHRTPVLTSRLINQRAGAELFFKCENLQKAGAFKFRGASNALAQLSQDELKRGVVTHSSGNHAAALALAAQSRRVTAHIIMPENSPRVKIEAVKAYGGIIHFCPVGLEHREQKMKEVQLETQAVFIHPYHHPHIIAGQGTAALELMEDSPNLDIILAPLGGGGLLSGTAIASKAMNPKIRVIGVEPTLADDGWWGFYSGIRQPAKAPRSIADGLLTSVGETNFQIIQDKVDEIMRVDEDEILIALRWIWERMKILVEPSAAVGLAAVMKFPRYFANKRTGIILSGGNVSLENLHFT